MKSFFRSIITSILIFIARNVIRRYRPLIVMISGSVGKTSTKDAVAEVLSVNYLVRKSEKSFNSEFGVPFTILGVRNPWRNLFAWFSVIKNSFALLFLPNHYPNMLVLEVGADRPGDIAKIMRAATPNVVVITRLPDIPVHVESYASPKDVMEEEFSPAYYLPASAPLIIPAEDQYALNNSVRTPARVITYGYADNADVRICNDEFYIKDGIVIGMKADITIDGQNINFVVKGSVGATQLLPVTAAVAVARAFNISSNDALKALENYEPPSGRGRLIRGINSSIIIDDTYNASPAAVENALITLKKFPNAKRRVAVLGDMLELGRYSVSEHERIGLLAHDSADIIICVGIRARAYAAKNSDNKAMLVDNSQMGALTIQSIINAGDVILVKGSQSIRMERLVEAILADPSDTKLLVRQDREWKLKP